MAPAPVNDTDPTIGRLVTDASRDISTLISKEIQLAKSELKVSVKAGGIGAVFFVVAGFIALLGVILLSISFAYLIHWNGQGLDLHWAYLIVTGTYFLLAILCVLIGVRKVKQVKAPERAIRQAQEMPGAFSRSGHPQ